MKSLRNLRSGARWYDRDGGRRVRRLRGRDAPGPHRIRPPDPYWLGLTALQAVITHKHPPRAVVPALLLADATRHAPTQRGRYLEHALTTAAQIYNGTSTWTEDPYLQDVLAPITGGRVIVPGRWLE